MQTREWNTKDKSAWGAGPWQDEPDKKQWQDEATGLPCLIVRNHNGALCGYVGVTEAHPWHGKNYSDRVPLTDEVREQERDPETLAVIPMFLHSMSEDDGMVSLDLFVNVHGGLTFAGACRDGDVAKSICHVPDAGEPDNVWWFGFDCAHAGDASPGSDARYPQFMDYGDVYRNIEYVQAQVASLARQIAAQAAS